MQWPEKRIKQRSAGEVACFVVFESPRVRSRTQRKDRRERRVTGRGPGSMENVSMLHWAGSER
jgi:hypothetical protein